MKRSYLVAAVVSALSQAGVAATLNNDAQLALDSALDAAQCKADDEAETERKRKAAEDAAKMTPQPAGTPAAMDAAAVDAVIAAKGYVTKTDADKLAKDAADAAVARVNALHKAREDVKPLVGIVAFDSAEAVYEFALKQAQVAIDGVPPAAYPALVEQVKARKAAPVASATPKFASDAASVVSQAIPGLGRFAAA